MIPMDKIKHGCSGSDCRVLRGCQESCVCQQKKANVELSPPTEQELTELFNGNKRVTNSTCVESVEQN